MYDRCVNPGASGLQDEVYRLKGYGRRTRLKRSQRGPDGAKAIEEVNRGPSVLSP